MIVDPNYTDDGALREQDLVSLDEFLADHDRAQYTGRGTAFFSGRERELSRFRDMLNGLSLNRQANATIVVEGPPGAGKSALLFQFMEEMRNLPNTERGGRRWLPVLINGARAECPRHIGQAVDEAISRRLAEDYGNVLGPGEKAAAEQALSSFFGPEALKKVSNDFSKLARLVLDRGFSATGIQVGAARPDEDIEALTARRAPSWNGWQVILLIDESQKISEQVPGAVPGTLSSIHQGAHCGPLSFCAFGLPGTWDALADVGVSRSSVAYDLPLAGLESQACRLAIRRCFERFDVRDADAWEEVLVARSANWPQHLTAYLNGMLTALKPKAVGENAIGSVREASLRDALALGDQGRKAFCARRLDRLTKQNRLFDKYAVHVVQWLSEADSSLKSFEITERLMSSHGLSAEEATEFQNAAEYGGLLAVDKESRTCSTAIPSFAGYLLGESPPPVSEPEFLAGDG